MGGTLGLHNLWNDALITRPSLPKKSPLFASRIIVTFRGVGHGIVVDKSQK